MKKTQTKKTTKPKAKKKLVREAEPVEFVLDNAEQAQEVCAHLAQLENTMGWIYLKKMLEASLLVIQDQILTKKDLVSGVLLTDEEVDVLRASYLAYKELINKPASLIENIKNGNRPTAPEYDPYSSGVKDSQVNNAGVLGDEMDD